MSTGDVFLLGKLFSCLFYAFDWTNTNFHDRLFVIEYLTKVNLGGNLWAII